MKTSHRIAATLLITTALASCATDTDDDVDNDSPQEDVTTDTNESDD